MLLNYLRNLSSPVRTDQSNRQLGQSLAFVAGATNAGGFLLVRQYTSHMSGIVSGMADDLAMGDIALLLSGMGALLCFLFGAAGSAILINWGRRHHLHSEYAGPLVVEALLLLCFGMIGGNIAKHEWLFVPATVALLCFIMGLQNAIISKISRAEIRTTHVTGIITDIGIELGKLIYWNGDKPLTPVLANYVKLRLLSLLLLMFFIGGVVGALCFKHIGFISTIPLAILILVLGVVPVIDDLTEHLRQIT
jgi:uncharacterized membrane protein YoaK (UPF0700 family)